jgi:hypothetical protein
MCCAERKMIYDLKRESFRCGVPNHKFPQWVHRKYGRLVIWRVLHDGSMGLSYPCVVCRKVLDRNSIEWIAHLGTTWYSSKDLNLPKSKPTQKQKTTLGYT